MTDVFELMIAVIITLFTHHFVGEFQKGQQRLRGHEGNQCLISEIPGIATLTVPPYCPCSFLILPLPFCPYILPSMTLSQEMSGHLQRDKRAGQVTRQPVMGRDSKKGGVTRGGVGQTRGSEPPGTHRQNQKRGADVNLKHMPDSKAHHLHPSPPSSLPRDLDLIPYTLPSHSDTLFTHLHRLKEEKLLLDCIFPLKGDSFQAHRLVLAAASQTPDAFFGSKQKPGTLGIDQVSHRLTPVGLRVVLDFAYSGDIVADLSKDGVMEEVLDACRCLGTDRLTERCATTAATPAATERERSLAIINDMWERRVGCDVTIQAESGERHPGKRSSLNRHWLSVQMSIMT